jgi:hypothetical protein
LVEKDFKKKFPNLAKEMKDGVSILDINFISGIPKVKRKFAGYYPNEIDFIRRCTSEEQAKDIIDFLEYRKEINLERAQELRFQLEKKGLNSFGKKKNEGFYEREG